MHPQRFYAARSWLPHWTHCPAARVELTAWATTRDRGPTAEADMAAMRALSGAALDRKFLVHVIPHHGGGLEPAHRAHPVLRRPELSSLATDVMDAQARQVGEMIATLPRLGGLP